MRRATASMCGVVVECSIDGNGCAVNEFNQRCRSNVTDVHIDASEDETKTKKKKKK